MTIKQEENGITTDRNIAVTEYIKSLEHVHVNGYGNSRSSLEVSTSRVKGEVLQVSPPVMHEFAHGTDNYQHSVNYNYFGALNSGNVFAFFHGGPGSGMAPKHASYLNTKRPDVKICREDPRVFAYSNGLIQFQQPASKFLYDTVNYNPCVNLQYLNTSMIVDSLAVAHNSLLDHGLQAQSLAVTGLSCGSTFAALFAQKYPEKTCGIGLYGVFWGTGEDIKWALQGAHEEYSPELADSFKKFCRENGGDPKDFISSYSYFFNHHDFSIEKEALYHFYRMELHTEECLDFSRQEFDEWYANGSPSVFDQKRLRAHTMIHFAENNFWLDPKYGIAPAIESIAANDVPVVLGISGNDRLLPKRKRTLSFIDSALSCVKPENKSLIYTGDGAHLHTNQVVLGNHELRSHILKNKGLVKRFNV